MNNPAKPTEANAHGRASLDQESPGDETPAKGPNLVLLYSLLALGLLAAMAFAAAIVWPFYIQR